MLCNAILLLFHYMFIALSELLYCQVVTPHIVLRVYLKRHLHPWRDKALPEHRRLQLVQTVACS